MTRPTMSFVVPVLIEPDLLIWVGESLHILEWPCQITFINRSWLDSFKSLSLGQNLPSVLSAASSKKKNSMEIVLHKVDITGHY